MGLEVIFFLHTFFLPLFLSRHYQLRRMCVTGSAVRFSKLFTTSCLVWTSKSWTMIRKTTAAELLVSGYVISFFMGLSLDALLSYTYMPGESLCFVEKINLFKISELQLRAMFGTRPAHLLAHDCDVVQR